MSWSAAGVKKEYYLETRCDVLVKNREVFAYWKRLGLHYMFLGLESIDEEGLKLHRKRVVPGDNFKALEVARELGITVALNIIADPDWDEARFTTIREWALSIPEIVHLTVNTPYPGTETWLTESRKLDTLDYRLFDVQHAVLPTRLPLDRFYGELVKTQAVLSPKTPRLLGHPRGDRHHCRPAPTRADQLRQGDLEVQSRVQREAAAGRPRAAGDVHHDAAQARR